MHVEVTSEVSVILAGIILKYGVIGFIQFIYFKITILGTFTISRFAGNYAILAAPKSLFSHLVPRCSHVLPCGLA